MSDPVIRLIGVGKMYKVFASRRDRVLDALGMARFVFWRRVEGRQFWALRGIDLELERGSRIGIIGRNGAGKTTLLKLLTGSLEPTEGALEVRGKVQPLIDVGAGFNAELSGYENIDASLAYQGLTPSQIKAATADIEEFTELGGFLAQPIKTYSLGMQSRLAFATATAVRPEILVVDEVLGAGDAYFFAKSVDRMTQLVESGVTVIIVSHQLDQITRFCQEVLWIDRGRLVRRGPSLETVKAYQEFMHVLEDRRLRAKNRKVRLGRYSAEENEGYVDALLISLTVSGEPGSLVEVEQVTLRRNGEIEDWVEVGSAQDADPSHASFVLLDQGDWSAPEWSDGRLCRRLAPAGPGAAGTTTGTVRIGLHVLFPESEYAVDVSYRCHGTGGISMRVSRRDELIAACDLPPAPGRWAEHRTQLRALAPEPATAPHGKPAERPARRWPGEGSLRIAKVELCGGDGREKAVFRVGERMRLRATFEATCDGTFPMIPTATLYRLDGVLVSNHVGPSTALQMTGGDRRDLELDFASLNLGNGGYVFTVAIYRKLSAVEGAEWYDLMDRSYEFQVVGNGAFEDGVFRHPAEWRIA